MAAESPKPLAMSQDDWNELSQVTTGLMYPLDWVERGDKLMRSLPIMRFSTRRGIVGYSVGQTCTNTCIPNDIWTDVAYHLEGSDIAATQHMFYQSDRELYQTTTPRALKVEQRIRTGLETARLEIPVFNRGVEADGNHHEITAGQTDYDLLKQMLYTIKRRKMTR